MPAGLEPPTKFPSLLSHLWSAFLVLNRARSAGFSGPNPISYEQIKAWKELTANDLEPWEVDVVMKLDGIYLGVAHG
jgi:hypothetical protein